MQTSPNHNGRERPTKPRSQDQASAQKTTPKPHLSPEEMRYLGVSTESGLKELQEQYPAFHGASDYVLKILARNLASSSLIEGKLKARREGTESLIDMLKDSENPVKSLRALSKHVAIFTESAEEFQKQLYYLRIQRHGPRHSKCPAITYDLPMPDNARVVISLGRCVMAMLQIRLQLSKAPGAMCKRVTTRIDRALRHSDIQHFTNNSDFLQFAADPFCNAYQLCTRKQLNEFKNRFGFEVDESSNIQQNFDDLDFSDTDDLEKYGETCSAINLKMALKKLAAVDECESDLSEAAKQGLKLCGVFEDICPKSFEGNLPHSYLRVFPFRILQDGLASVDYHARCALMLLSDGAKFAEISSDSTIEITGYHNPMLVHGLTGRGDQPTSVVDKLLEPHSQNKKLRERLSDSSKNTPASSINLKELVPLSFSSQPVGETQGRGFLISGSNRSGKSQVVCGIARAILDNQAGLPLMCTSAKLPIVKRLEVVAPPPAQNSGELGFFRDGVNKLAMIAARVGPGDVVIADEVPSGSDSAQVVAVATALYEDIVSKGALLIATSHFKQTFKLLCHSDRRMRGVKMDISLDNGRPVPSYTFSSGIAVHSHAIELMSAAGFDARTIDLARRYFLMLQDNNYVAIPKCTPEEVLNDEPGLIGPQQKSDCALLCKALFRPEFFMLDYIDYWKILYYAVAEPENINIPNYVNHDFLSSVRDLADLSEEVLKTLRTELQSLYSARGASIKNRHEEIRLSNLTAEDTASVKNSLTKMFLLLPDKASLETFKLLIVGCLAQIDRDAANDLHRSMNCFKQPSNNDDTRDVAELIGSSNGDKEQGGAYASVPRDQEPSKALPVYFFQRIDLLLGSALSIQSQLNKVEPSSGSGISMEKALPLLNFPSIRKTLNSDITPANLFMPDGIAQSFTIPEGSNAAVLLGPNGSGKSVLNRSLFFCALMALKFGRSWASLKLGGIDEVCSYFGAEAIPNSGKSYFEDALSKLAKNTSSARPGRLLIIDEIIGSDPIELAAIQLAVLKRVTERGAKVLYNTNLRHGLNQICQLEGYTGLVTDSEFDPQNESIKPLFTISSSSNLENIGYGLSMVRSLLTQGQYQRASEIYHALQ